MSELLTRDETSEADGRTDLDAVQEMYTQAVNNNALDDGEKALLEDAAAEVGTTVDQLKAAHDARKEAATVSLQGEVAKHALNEASNIEYWTKPKA